MNLRYEPFKYLIPRLSDLVERRKPARLLAGAKRLKIKSLQKTQQHLKGIASILAPIAIGVTQYISACLPIQAGLSL